MLYSIHGSSRSLSCLSRIQPSGYPEPLITQWAKTSVIMALQFLPANPLPMGVNANAHHSFAVVEIM